jgi:O-antigen/teichoic acid export membrane protein
MLVKIIDGIKGHKKYFFYGSSILFSRGVEYLILFFAPLMLSKQDYGELEFYKRIIEFSSTILVFGLPTLLVTYSKSYRSKTYLLIFSLVVIISLSMLTIPFLYYLNYLFLLIPILFYAIFFSNGVLQMYFLVAKGSNTASLFKIIVSSVFYSGVFLLIVYSKEPALAFVNSGYFLFPLGLIVMGWLIYSLKPKIKIFFKYLKLFKKLLISSSTLVISTIANMMFMYSDIFIVKILSPNPSIEIANFSFVLNITNMIILIPMTLVQVDIEKIKKESYDWLQGYRKKTFIYTSAFSIFIMLGYFILINTFYEAYKDTMILFLILFVGKIIQSNSVFLGTQVLIKKYFIENLKINLITVTFNVIASYLCYLKFGLLGIALVSALSLAIRYIVLMFYYKKIYR